MRSTRALRAMPLARTVTVLSLLLVVACDPQELTRCGLHPLADGVTLEEHTAFQGAAVGAGPDGYPVFRIPSAVTTASGVILAFAEARQSLQDPGAGEIELVMKRSLDCGRSWSRTRVLAENGSGDSHNPAAVVVPGAGRRSTVWLFYNERPASPGGEFDLPPGLGPDSASIWVRTSDDDGVTWSAPRELTREVKDPSWAIASMGPGTAILTRWGTAAAAPGRLVVPGWYTSPPDGPDGSFVMLSDDGGATWRRGGLPAPLTSEAQVVELTDGTVQLDARQERSGDLGHRYVFASRDGGESWGDAAAGLDMPRIMASVLRYGATRDGDAYDLLLHSGILTDEPLGLRRGVRVWASLDEGRTWAYETPIHPGFSQYSVLTRLDDGSVGLLYESVGASSGSLGLDIRFARFRLEHLAGGALTSP